MTTNGDVDGQVAELTGQLRRLEEQYAAQVVLAADAEAEYRNALADALREQRTQGHAQAEATVYARGETAQFARRRDVQAGLVRVLEAQMESRRGERVSLLALAKVRGGLT